MATTKKTATNSLGIVQQFFFTSANHPFVKVDANNVATVSIPAELVTNFDNVSNLSAAAIITPYNVKEFGLLSRWLCYANGCDLSTTPHIIPMDDKGTRIQVKDGKVIFKVRASHLGNKFWPTSSIKAKAVKA